MLRPLPFEDPEELVWIANQESGGMSLVTSRASNLRDFRAMNQSFEAMTGYMAFFEYESYNLTSHGRPERLVGVGVARDFLEVLGVEPMLGRNFVEEEGIWDGRPGAGTGRDQDHDAGRCGAGHWIGRLVRRILAGPAGSQVRSHGCPPSRIAG